MTAAAVRVCVWGTPERVAWWLLFAGVLLTCLLAGFAAEAAMTGRHRSDDIWYRCHNCQSTHEIESIRKNLYYAQRSIGDYQALRRGRLGRRLVRRTVTRSLMRGLWGN